MKPTLKNALILLSCAILLSGCSPAQQIPTSQANPATPTPLSAAGSLRTYASQRGLLIGAAVAYTPLTQDPLYAQVLASEFGMLTPENAMKFEVIHPSEKTYDFSQADTIVKFAEQNGMQVRGHTLVWHDQLPSWVTNGNFTRDQLIAILKDHITAVAGHYRGQIAAWDVVNEAVDEDGTLRDTIWLKTIGPDYIDMAFNWAHAADPQAKLFYNDYNDEGLGKKSDAIYALVQAMKARGVPIDGVGFQSHFSLDAPPQFADVANNMRRLTALGFEVQITEMDVRIPGEVTPEKLSAQADIYREMLQICLGAGKCTAFVMWGFTDRYSWIPDAFPGFGSALIFDDHYAPKPAARAVLDVLMGK